MIEDGAVVPGRTCTVTLSCDADRIEASTAALWLTYLARVLEQPLLFLPDAGPARSPGSATAGPQPSVATSNGAASSPVPNSRAYVAPAISRP